MPTCKNDKSKTYTGNENTPLGRGYHANGEKVGKRMKGKDGHNYQVISVKGRKKRWQKISSAKSPKRTKRGRPVKSTYPQEMSPSGKVGVIGVAADNYAPSKVYGDKPWVSGMPIFTVRKIGTAPEKDSEPYCEFETEPISPGNLDSVYFTIGKTFPDPKYPKDPEKRKGFYDQFIMSRDPKNPEGPWKIRYMGPTRKEITYPDP